MVFFGCQYHRFKMQRCRTVSGVTDNMNKRITDSLHHSMSVFFYRSIFITQRVDTRDTDIKHLHIVLVQIEVSFTIQNINLSPQQQLHPIHPAGNHMQVSKINRMASTGNTGRVFRYP